MVEKNIAELVNFLQNASFTSIPEALDGDEAFGGPTQYDIAGLSNDTAAAHSGSTITSLPVIVPRLPARPVDHERVEHARKQGLARRVTLAILKTAYSFEHAFAILGTSDEHLEALDYIIGQCVAFDLFATILLDETMVAL